MTTQHDPMAALEPAAAPPAGLHAVPGLRDRIAALLTASRIDLAGDVTGQVLDLIRAHVAELPRPDISIGHVDAVRILYARTAGDSDPLAQGVRAALGLHYVMPPLGGPVPDCTSCKGTGQASVDGMEPRHCCCGCPLCACGEPICGGPCETIDALLEPLLGGVPSGAVDVERMVAKLSIESVRRIVVAAIDERIGAGHGRQCVIAVDEDPAQPGTLVLHVNSGGNSLAAEQALDRRGYRCEPVAGSGLADVIYGVRLRVRPPG